MRHFEDTAPPSIADASSPSDALLKLDRYIDSYRTAVTDEGVWLFLATLGCWSVGEPFFQMLAYLVAAVVFASRVSAQKSEKSSFYALARQIERRISVSGESAEVRARQLEELEELRARKLVPMKEFREGKVFLLCWVFFVVSLMYSLAMFAKRVA
jgi:hypothetical protein